MVGESSSLHPWVGPEAPPSLRTCWHEWEWEAGIPRSISCSHGIRMLTSGRKRTGLVFIAP